jgi:hypothetical protein
MPRSLILVFVCGLFTVACHSREVDRSQKEFDRAAVQSYLDDQRVAGVVAEHTIWPHYFLPNSADFSELGQHNLALLASFYRDNPGPLAVRRGDESADLYAARVAAVHQALVDGGVEAPRIEITDAPAGGPGMPSSKVVQILDRRRESRRSSGSSSGTASGMETSR